MLMIIVVWLFWYNFSSHPSAVFFVFFFFKWRSAEVLRRCWHLWSADKLNSMLCMTIVSRLAARRKWRMVQAHQLRYRPEDSLHAARTGSNITFGHLWSVLPAHQRPGRWAVQRSNPVFHERAGGSSGPVSDDHRTRWTWKASDVPRKLAKHRGIEI